MVGQAHNYTLEEHKTRPYTKTTLVMNKTGIVAIWNGNAERARTVASGPDI